MSDSILDKSLVFDGPSSCRGLGIQPLSIQLLKKPVFNYSRPDGKAHLCPQRGCAGQRRCLQFVQGQEHCDCLLSSAHHFTWRWPNARSTLTLWNGNGTITLHMGCAVGKAEPFKEAVQVVSTTSHKKDRKLDMADALLVCREGTGVLVSRLRVTEDIANPQNCSLKCPQKSTLLVQWQWLATKWVEPRVLRLHRQEPPYWISSWNFVQQ